MGSGRDEGVVAKAEKMGEAIILGMRYMDRYGLR